MKNIRKPSMLLCRIILPFAFLLIASSVSIFGQATKGTLRGTITDPNGQVISGAIVTATNDATHISTQTTTTSDGLYVIPELAPGQYSVSAEAAGFSKRLMKNITVSLGLATNLSVELAVGAPTEVVTVTSGGEELALQRDQSQISTTFDNRKIQDLPSNGAASGLDTIALLAPGITTANSGGVNTNGTGLSVNGNRARANNFQIDGADNNDLVIGGPANFLDNQEAVQEYQIITNNYSAQYGRNQGAVFNIVTKSGTNDFHGSLFEFHRDNAVLNSLDNIERASGQTRPNPALFNIFGGTVGGPVYLPRFGEGGKTYLSGKDKLFFYFAYQGVRNPATTTLRSNSLAILPGQFPGLLAAFPGNAVISDIAQFSTFAIPGASPNTTITGAVVPSSFNLGAPSGCPRAISVGSTSPAGCGSYTTFIDPATGAPYLTGGPYDVINLGTVSNPRLFQAAQYQRNFATPFQETDYNIKFDAIATQRDTITVRYLKQSLNFINQLTSTANGFQGDIISSSKNFGGSWTRRIASSKFNEFRATYQRIGVVFGGGTAAGEGQIPDPLDIGSTITNIAFSGVFGVTKSSASLSTIGPSNLFPQARTGKVYQVADNFTYTRGLHSLIFGAEYKHIATLAPFLPNYNGSFSFSSVTRLLNNAPSSIGITAGEPLLSYSENDQYYFVQDDFRVRPNLTLNLGVRYEYTGQPINLLNQLSVARESNSATAFYNPALPLSIRTVPKIPTDKNNWAPRFGFAYTPHFWKKVLGEDATVIRGGFSIAYEPAFYNILQNVQNGAPFSAALSLGTSLLPATNSPFPIPAGAPTSDLIRASAASSGILPLGKLNPIYLAQSVVAPDFHAPYSEQWSFGIQHQFGKNHVAEVRYVGTHGVGLFQNVNGNFFVGPMLKGLPNWFGSGIDLPAFPQFVPSGVRAQVCVNDPATFDNEAACNGRVKRQGSLTIRQNSAESIYHSMQSRYSGRFLNNSLSWNASYTWSKTIDDASEIFSGGGFDIASANAQNPFCINRCERSLSQLDRPHAFSANFIYDVPVMKEQRGIVGHFLGGWQLNGVYVLTSGEPYTPGQFFNGNVLGVGNAYLTSGDRPFIGNSKVDPRQVGISQIDALGLFGTNLTNPKGFYSLNELNTTGNEVSVTPNDVHFIYNGPGAASIFGTPFGDATRNSLRGPKLNQLNMGLFKNTKIGEHITVQIRAEAFNVLNHPSPGYGVNSNAAAGFGYLPSYFVDRDAGVSGGGFAENKDIEYARRVIQFGLRIVF